nr:hypothetical protein [uncultured Roseateles sp.]
MSELPFPSSSAHGGAQEVHEGRWTGEALMRGENVFAKLLQSSYDIIVRYDTSLRRARH